MPLARRLQAEHVDDLVEKLDQLHLVAVQAQHAVLDLGDIEQAVDEARQVLGAAADHAHGIVRSGPAVPRSISCA